jgi:chromosome segregation ATPase
VRRSSAGPPISKQPHRRPSSWPDAHAAHGASPFQNATPEERVPEGDDDGGGSTEHHANPDVPSRKEIAQLEDERLIELERQLSETLVAKTERDQRIAQLTDDLALKSALLEQAAEEKKRARLELRELQAKLDELLLSRDHALKQAEANAAAEEMKRSGLELRGLQAQVDDLLLSRDHAVEQAEANAAEERERAGLELRELQAQLDESLLSCDHALEQAQSALQKASYVAEANQQSQRGLTEMRAKLEAKMSESALALRLRLADADMDSGCAKSKEDADTYRTQTATGLVNADELLERVQALVAEMMQCAVEREKL